jgi:C4-dicarboxylate-specific signal transduction histidine kinase
MNSRDAFVKNKIIAPSIHIKIYKEDDYKILSIKDNAGGVNDEILKKIFDPYFTTKHKAQNIGLSLYVAKILIEYHMNGTIDAFNVDDGLEIIVKFQK